MVIGDTSSVRVEGSSRVVLYELDEAQALCNLPHREIVLVPLPKATAASVFRVMADAVAFESDVWIAHIVFELRQIERRIRAIDAGCAHTPLNTKAHAQATVVACEWRTMTMVSFHAAWHLAGAIRRGHVGPSR